MKTVLAAVVRQGRAFVIVALVFSATGAMLVFPVNRMFLPERDSIAQSLARLSLYQAAIASRPQLEAELRRVQDQNALIVGLVPGTGAPLAAANIQSEIKNIVARNAGEIRSSQNLPPSTADGFEKVEIVYDIALPADHLKDLIYQLETHTPYFFLDTIDVQMPQNGSPQSAETSAPRAEVRLTIRGYRWAGG